MNRLVALTVGLSLAQGVPTIALATVRNATRDTESATVGRAAPASTVEKAGGSQPAQSPEPPVMQVEELARLIASPTGERPLIIHVGFRKLYEQAHIPGSEFIGPASDKDGLAALRKRVEALPRTRSIVVYCGCCPWNRCPNVLPAGRMLREMGFENARLLYLPRGFQDDWVSRGYAVSNGR